MHQKCERQAVQQGSGLASKLLNTGSVVLAPDPPGSQCCGWADLPDFRILFQIPQFSVHGRVQIKWMSVHHPHQPALSKICLDCLTLIAQPICLWCSFGSRRAWCIMHLRLLQRSYNHQAIKTRRPEITRESLSRTFSSVLMAQRIIVLVKNFKQEWKYMIPNISIHS